MGSVEYDERVLHRGLAFARVVAVLFLLGAILDAATVLQILAMAAGQYAEIVCGELGFAALAVAQVALGARIYDGGTGATVLGVLVSGFSALFAIGWFVFLLVQGGIALLPLFVALGSFVSGVTALVLIPVTRSIGEQRRLLLDGL
jgi:hypothetical protein